MLTYPGPLRASAPHSPRSFFASEVVIVQLQHRARRFLRLLNVGFHREQPFGKGHLAAEVDVEVVEHLNEIRGDVR